MLTPRKNLLSVFRHEVPEWIPLVGHVDPYNQPNQKDMDPELAEQLREVRWQDETTLAFSRWLGIDVMDYLGPPVRSVRHNVTAESTTEGRDTTNTWHTPQGDLREVVRRSEDGNTSYRVEHLVKGAGDLPALAAAFEDETHEFDPVAARAITERMDQIGDDGMLMLFCPGTPMGMMYRVFSGVEALVYCCVDAPEALRDLFQVMETNYQQVYRIAAESSGDALVGMDDTSTTTISPDMFEAYNLELTDQRTDIAHAAGKLYFHHSCGLIHDLLPLYRQTKMDAVHAFTIPPTGDVTIAEGRRLLGDKITIIAGAAPLGGNMDDRTAAADIIRDMFEGAGHAGHFILNVTAYPDKTMEQTQFVVDECRRWQRPS